METVSIRVPDDVRSKVEAYADKKGISTSEAYRRHLRQGIEYTELKPELVEIENRLAKIEKQTLPLWERL